MNLVNLVAATSDQKAVLRVACTFTERRFPRDPNANLVEETKLQQQGIEQCSRR
jgi:hypothetical protein